MAHLEDDLNQQNHNHYYGVGGLRTIKAFFANYVNFTGKSNRREFWWTTLFETVFLVILLFSAGAIVVQHVLKVINSGHFAKGSGLSDLLGGSVVALIILLVVMIILLLPSLALTIRRFRDAGVSWMVYVALVLIGIASVLIFSNNSAVSSVVTGLVSTAMIIIELLPTKAD
ncbi:DUF805 domain-containing protein [Lacticaseibacillus nasuensis]|nr:DUF805 domain-containing protein [Lacticaseibacillus nasuensis]